MTDDEFMDRLEKAMTPPPEQVAGAFVRVAEKLDLRPGVMVLAPREEFIQLCAACGEEIPEDEGKWSWTLDARICTGCGQDGDNP